MKVLFRVSAVLAFVFTAAFGLRQSLHATPTSAIVSDQCQAEACACGCAEGEPCDCTNCPLCAARECDALLETYRCHHLDIDAWGAYRTEPLSELIANWEAAGRPTTYQDGQDAADAVEAYILEQSRLNPEQPTPAVEPQDCTPVAVVPDSRPELDLPDPVNVPLTHDGNGYLTTSAIRHWLNQNSSGTTWSYGGGNYGAPLRNHLIRTHGWRESQLIGLSDSELRELHSADHNGRLGPRSEVEMHITLTSATDDGGVAVYFDTSDDFWHWRHNGVGHRWHTLTEGATYNGRNGDRFVYRDGRMHVTSSAPQTATTPAPVQRTYSPPVLQSSGGCPNGRCGGYSTRRWRWR